MPFDPYLSALERGGLPNNRATLCHGPRASQFFRSRQKAPPRSGQCDGASHLGLLRHRDHDVLPRPPAAALPRAPAENVAEIAIELIDGWLPPRGLRLVLEWAGEHRDELRANWDRARADEQLA
jgi:hypothetical protein